MPPSTKRGGKAAGRNGPVKKRTKKGPEEDERLAGFFLAAEDEGGAGGSRAAADEEEAEEVETAQDKRLRLARQYLTEMAAQVDDDDHRGGSGGSDGDDDDDGDEDDDEDGAGRGDEEDGEDTDGGAGRRKGGKDAKGAKGAKGGMEAFRQRLTERLKEDAAEVHGRLHRRLAHRVALPSYCVAAAAAGDDGSGVPTTSRGHMLSATAVALTTDERTAFTVSKDGSIVRWDVETMTKTPWYRPGDRAASSSSSGAAGPSGSKAAAAGGVVSEGPEWVKKRARQGSAAALYAAAVSSDGQYLAVGGGDKKIYVFDARSGSFVQHYPGHKDSITGLAFREGSHQLFSASADRTVKLWSLDDRAYMDTLFGHQADVLAVDCLRQERVVTGGLDHTARVWKIPEESQLIYRSRSMALDCIRYVTSTEWVSGSGDGSISLWSQLKKKPTSVVRGAHGAASAAAYGQRSAGHVDAEAVAWVQSVAVARGSDLVASGAGDGCVRLWAMKPGTATGQQASLSCIGGLPTRGFVNGLALGRSGQLVVAAVGQEPRLGRWARDAKARNGLAVHRLTLSDE